MTDKSARTYMKQQGWYDHLVLPAPNIRFTDAPDSDKWAAKPCGNCPGVMPIDQ